MNKWVWQIQSFDLPNKFAIPILITFLSFYIYNAIPELYDTHDWTDYQKVEHRLSHWNISQIAQFYDVHVRYALLKLSIDTFHNVKVLPLLESIGVLITSYFLTVKLSGKRIAGIFTISLISSSHLFKYFDTSAAFDNSWILFYLLSIYFISKHWYISPILFILSILCKPLTILFLPATFYYIFKSELKHKKTLSITYGLITLLILIGFSLNSGTSDYNLEFNSNEFLIGLTEWWFFMFSDIYMIALVPVVMLCLYILSRKGYKNTLQVLVLMLAVVASGGIIEGFTDLNNEPYRFIPLVVFFAIGIGLFFQQKPIQNT